MKKLFILLTMLIVGIGSMWATSPAAGAYPVEGKTYYLFANGFGNTNRYHLYWDNTNSALKHATANSKDSNSDYYKWTVTVSDEKYYINNVGTGTKLAWDSNKGLTLTSSGSLFDLSNDVHYSACVSLYNPSGFWCCIKEDTETFASGYKFSSFPADNYSTSYPIDFVFEEVLSAHSLENGKFYTIYCDNDNKQYLYDNAGTLAQTNSAPDADYKYIWECIVSGDYYNFRNLQTGKYLSHKAISSTANNFNIETTDVYHDGCVKLKTGSNYMGFTKDGSPDQASHAQFPKITTDYSFDFRFDEVDLSSWCTGDLLGGSMSGSNNWTNTWTSGTNPQFTLTSGNNDINNTNGRTQGGLDIRSGNTTAGYDTYTITAPTGYLITGYKIVGYALNGDQTVTPSKGGDATVFTTAGNSIYVSGLRQGKASFKLSGANNGLFIRALQVSLTPMASSITSLPTANDKAYVIYNARAVWNFVDNATSMTTVTLPNTDLDNAQQQIALVYYNENYYLYSINAKKFLTAENTLTSEFTDKEQVSITATGNDTYPWFFKFKNVSNSNINIDGSGNVFINWWATQDDGNRNAIIEAADIDPTTSLEIQKSFMLYEIKSASKIPALFSSTKVEEAKTAINVATTTDEATTAYDNFWRTAEGKKFYAVSHTATGQYMNIGTSQITATSTSLTANALMEVKYAGSGKYYLKGINSGYYAGYPTSGTQNPGTTNSESNAAPLYIGNYGNNSENVLYFTTSRSNEYTTAIHYNSGYTGYIVAWTYSVDASQWNITAFDEQFAALKNASKFDILEGSTVQGPSEFAAPASINDAIDAAQEVADNDEAKIAFIVSSNGTMIQNYLDKVAIHGALANIQFTMSKEYGTLILPCPCTRIDGLDIYSCSSSENNVLTLTPVAGNYAYETPYIIHATEGNKYTIIGWDKGGTSTYEAGWLTGVLNSETYIPDGSYMLATNKTTGVQAFYKVSGNGVTCAKNKCYLTVPNETQARTLYLDIDGEITAIEEVFGDETEQGAIYNLAGQRLTKAQKGINIINGKKVLK